MDASHLTGAAWNFTTSNGTVKARLVHNITVTSGLCLSFATYSVITGLLSLLTCLSVAMNAAVLTTFLIHRRRLITPFTVHVVGLIVAGLIHSVVFFPMVVARPLVRGWMQHDPLSCAVFQYIIWLVPMLSFMQDFTICVDRWVAFLAPIWYRRESCVAYGLLGSVVFAFWLHAWYMPLNVLNYYTPLTERNGCDGTLYPKYRSVVYMMIVVLPQLGVLGSYPVLFYMLWRRTMGRIAARISLAVIYSIQKAPSPKVMVDGEGMPHPCQNPSIICCRSPSAAEVEVSANSRPIIHAEHVNNKLATVLVLLKLMSGLYSGVPMALIMTAAEQRRYPPACTWDAFHLSEEMMGLVILAEPFVYLCILPGLREKFFALLGGANRLTAGIRPSNRIGNTVNH